jgi:hypothetical protein
MRAVPGQFGAAARLNLPALGRTRKSHILGYTPCPESGLLTTTQAEPSSAGRGAAEKNAASLAAQGRQPQVAPHYHPAPSGVT